VIHFYKVTKTTTNQRTGSSFPLLDVTTSIPCDRPVALIGHNSADLSSFLHLVAGSEIPSRGKILRDKTRFSPIINAGDGAGNTLIKKLSPLENIEFFAGMNGIDPGHLLAVVEAACGLGRLLRLPLIHLDPNERRALEVALLAAMPYDCYLVDRLHELKERLIWQLLHSARSRGAGLIFTTNRVTKVARFGRMGAVLRGGTVQLFPSMNMAIIAHEQ
jgi:capsular polysaccharide transport system ATP-binding protein